MNIADPWNASDRYLRKCLQKIVEPGTKTQNNCERRDSDGFEANEFYVVLDKVYKYDPDCDLDECIGFEFERFKIKKEFRFQDVKYQKLHSTNGMDDTIKSEDALQTGSVDIKVTEGVESNDIAHYRPERHTFIGHEADSKVHEKSNSKAVYNHVLNGDSVSVKYKDCFDFTSYEPLNDDMSTSLKERSHDHVNGGYSVNWSFSELFFFFFFFNISRKNSKTSKVNQQSVLNL